jgi:hypothetical protein
MLTRRITLKTNPADLGRAQTVRISLMVFRWCKKNIGVNNRKAYELLYGFQKGEPHECGEYEPEENKITIFWSSLESVEELIRTCIHEWIHYRQPILTQYFNKQKTKNQLVMGELLLVLVVLGFLALTLSKVFNKKVAKEKTIYFDIVDGMHRGKSVTELEDELILKYDFNRYEAGLVVSAALDGADDYAITYISELLKRKVNTPA